MFGNIGIQKDVFARLACFFTCDGEYIIRVKADSRPQQQRHHKHDTCVKRREFSYLPENCRNDLSSHKQLIRACVMGT